MQANYCGEHFVHGSQIKMPEHWKLQTNKMLKQKNALLNPKYLRNGHTFHSNPFFV